jgi:hypothetical protein
VLAQIVPSHSHCAPSACVPCKRPSAFLFKAHATESLAGVDWQSSSQNCLPPLFPPLPFLGCCVRQLILTASLQRTLAKISRASSPCTPSAALNWPVFRRARSGAERAQRGRWCPPPAAPREPRPCREQAASVVVTGGAGARGRADASERVSDGAAALPPEWRNRTRTAAAAARAKKSTTSHNQSIIESHLH